MTKYTCRSTNDNIRCFSSTRVCLVDENENNNNNNSLGGSNNGENSLPPIREVLAAELSNVSNQNNPNSENSRDNSSDNSNDNNSPSQGLDDNSTRSSEDGYRSDSNRSYFEEGTDAMVYHPVGEIAEDQLRRYITDTREIMHHPCEAGGELDDMDPRNDDIRQIFGDRNQELRQELRQRKESGMVPDSPSENSDITVLSTTSENNSGNVSNNKNDTASSSSIPADSASTNKSKFIEDAESSTQPSKEEFKQDTSDNLPDVDNSSNIPSASFSTHKRKFDEDDGSSIQPSKKIKQESSDNTVTDSTSGTSSTNPDNQSPLDYVLEKQSYEMSDIYEADGE